MRSRFRVLIVVTAFVLAMLFVFLAGATSSIGAQAAPTPTADGSTSLSGTAAATEAVIPVFSTNNNGAFATLIETMLLPAGTALADVHANSGSDISFDTNTALGVSCANVFFAFWITQRLCRNASAALVSKWANISKRLFAFIQCAATYDLVGHRRRGQWICPHRYRY